MSNPAPTLRYVGRIPVRNLWLLMLYASDLYQVSAAAQYAGRDNTGRDAANLVGRILADAVVTRLHRQLTRRFVRYARVLPRVRGRIDLLCTERRQLLQRGVVACRFHELSVDGARNRLVRIALTTIAQLATDKAVRERVRSLASRFRAAGVSAIRPSHVEIERECRAHDGRQDAEMLAAAQLALTLAIPDESCSGGPVPAPAVEDAWVRRLFERAVGGFYTAVMHRRGWTVARGKRLDWPVTRDTLSPVLQAILPTMQTDVVLDHAATQRRIVIDTKFNAIVRPGHYRTTTLRSGYLYQIYAYLQSQVGRTPLDAHAEGLLLHPAIEQSIEEGMYVQGHRIRFATVDLAGDANSIRHRLLYLVGADAG